MQERRIRPLGITCLWWTREGLHAEHARAVSNLGHLARLKEAQGP